jgi:aspartate aminotransferase
VEINLSPEKNFQFDAGLIEQKISSKTKAILLNSPSNPTGQILSEEGLRKVATIARKHGLLTISDDVYEYFFYTEEKPAHILKVAPDLADRTVLVNAVSKTYAMTGWRLGFAVGPEEIIQKMEELQSHSSSNPSSISQAAAVEALTGPQDSVEIMRLSFLERRNKLIDLMEGLKFILPDGAFYTMIDIREKKKTGESDLDFCLDLLNSVGVALVPGESFGKAAEGFVRLSFANPLSVIEAGIDALKKFRA